MCLRDWKDIFMATVNLKGKHCETISVTNMAMGNFINIQKQLGTYMIVTKIPNIKWGK